MQSRDSAILTNADVYTVRAFVTKDNSIIFESTGKFEFRELETAVLHQSSHPSLSVLPMVLVSSCGKRMGVFLDVPVDATM